MDNNTMIANKLANKKRSIYLVKYASGLYAVEKITKSTGITYFSSFNKEEAVDFFNNY